MILMFTCVCEISCFQLDSHQHTLSSPHLSSPHLSSPPFSSPPISFLIFSSQLPSSPLFSSPLLSSPLLFPSFFLSTHLSHANLSSVWPAVCPQQGHFLTRRAPRVCLGLSLFCGGLVV